MPVLKEEVPLFLIPSHRNQADYSGFLFVYLNAFLLRIGKLLNSSDFKKIWYGSLQQ